MNHCIDQSVMTLRDKINEHLSTRVHNGELNNEDLISIIDNLGAYLNLMTHSDYARLNGISYNGAKQRVETGKVKEYVLFGVELLIDNQ